MDKSYQNFLCYVFCFYASFRIVDRHDFAFVGKRNVIIRICFS